jgi:hypothetical protein
MNASVDLPTPKATNASFVELARTRERGDERSANAGPVSSHNVILVGLRASGFSLTGWSLEPGA